MNEGWQKVRKQPKVVEALRIVPDNADALKVAGVAVFLSSLGEIEILVSTIEGRMVGVEGAWLIRGVKGELYVCDDDVFRESYDFVNEGDMGDE